MWPDSMTRKPVTVPVSLRQSLLGAADPMQLCVSPSRPAQSCLPNILWGCPARGQRAEPCSTYSPKDGTSQLSTSWGPHEASPKITETIITVLLY